MQGGFYNSLLNSIEDLSNSGITHVWLPPSSQSAAPEGFLFSVVLCCPVRCFGAPLHFCSPSGRKYIHLPMYLFSVFEKSTEMPEEESIDIKFRLYDGSDIGPFRYSAASTVDFLKQRVVSDWPKGKTVVPKGINEVKLISSGKILENNKTVAQCKTPFGETAGGVTVMHVVVQLSPAKTKSGQRRRSIKHPKRLYAHAPFCEGSKTCIMHTHHPQLFSKQRNIVVSIFLLTISETRKRNQSTNRCSTASLRIPIRALDRDLVRPHQALLLLVLDRFQQTLEIDFEELRRVCSSSFVLGCLGGSIRFRKAIGKLEHFQYLIEICGFVLISHVMIVFSPFLALYHTCCSMDSQTIQRMAVLEAENELMDLEYNEDEDSQEEEHDLSVNEPAQSTHTQRPKRYTRSP
ncbi:hypothetical protein DY000_02038250 [Brassica cretica]|uniref:Ubiquitin-like domain-containing protein n=1 Tax=Brassica cretica TaxID=69181 RepID=A0ABQ7BLM8_BRACR|nr:hypothetical protein DY000_02038250 [Brassica cretica]